MELTREASAKPGKRLRKRKVKKRWLVLAVVIVAAGAAAFFARGKKSGAQSVLISDTAILSYTDLESSISGTGTIESGEVTKVYSTLAYQVKSVLVEVGDEVQEGDLLAELDAKNIENQITAQETSLAVSSGSANAQVQSAYDAYDNFKQGLDSGLNASLISAEAQVNNAYDAYVKAQNAYDRYKENVDLGENTQLLSAQSARDNAATALDTAEDNYDTLCDSISAADEQLAELNAEIEAAEAKKAELAESNGTESPEYLAQAIKLEALKYQKQTAESNLETAKQNKSSLRQALESAQSAYDIAQATYNAALRGEDQALSDYADAVDSAWRAYQTALTTLDSTKKGTEDQLESYADTLATANAGANTAISEESLRQLNETLDDTKITAPVSGTVTAVYASVGASGSGLLFVIEDTRHLVISTSIKGYDLANVETGMHVDIRSDATGDEIVSGTLSTIAPTAKKNALGETEVSTDPSFEAEIAVDEADSGLRIGMEARLSYIIAKAPHVLSVDYEAVFTDENGQSCILVLEEDAEGTLTLQKRPVTTGLDDDLDISIEGSGIEAGLRVVTAPKKYLAQLGKAVTLTQATGFEAQMEMMGVSG